MESKLKLIFFLLPVFLFSGCMSTAVTIDEGKTHIQQLTEEGKVFLLSSEFTTNVSIPVYFMGCTANNHTSFDSFNLDVEGTPFHVYFYESPTVSNNGTSITGYNMNRNYLDNHSLDLYYNPIVSNNGTRLFTVSDYGSKKIVGSSNLPSELILKANTCYLFEILNGDGTTADVTVNFIWHE